MELASWTEKKKTLKKVEIQNYGGKHVVGTHWEGGIQRALRAPSRAEAAAPLNFHRDVHQH